MESVREVWRQRKGKGSRYGRRYGLELKLRCVKLRLEEGVPVSLLSKEVGVSESVVQRWVRAYRERGEEGLRNPVKSSRSRRKLPGPVRKIYLHALDRAFYEEANGPGRVAKATLVRYADDFVVLARWIGSGVRKWMEEKLERDLGLKVNRGAYSVDSGHPFRIIPASCSGGFRPPRRSGATLELRYI